MESRDVVAELPHAYAVALRLRAAGFATDVIAAALGIEVEAVDPLLSVADAKLRRLQAREVADRDGNR